MSGISVRMVRQGMALGLGTMGGAVFWALNMPLPWMLGALCFTMVCSIAGLRLEGPARLRPIVIVVIGVMLGARFSPDVLGQADQWLGSLSLLLGFVLVSALVVVPFYRFFGGQDWTTAYFSGMPGGLAEMIEMGEARGADALAITLAHSFRVILTIALIAVWFRLIQGVNVGNSAALTLWDWPAPLELALLTAAGLLGAFVGLKLHLPAPTFLGPMIASALLHLTGLSSAEPPQILVIVAQIVLGTVLGARFSGMQLALLVKAAGLALGATLMALGLALGFAEIMVLCLGIDLEQAILGLAPGGLTEMGLIALAIQADGAFVALHHVVRILLVIGLAPLFYRLIARAKG